MVDQTGGAPVAGYVIVAVMVGIVLVALGFGVVAALVRRHREHPHEGCPDSEERVGELRQMAVDFHRDKRDRLGGG